MSEFHFLRPAWFIALAPALVLLVLLWRRRARTTGWRGVVAPTLLTHLLLDHDQPTRRAWLTMLGGGWLLAIVALAGPTWERQPQPLYRLPVDRVLVLDMSPSMAAGDVRPDRLSRARLLIRDLLAQAREGRAALVVFGAEPHVVTPLTDDVATIEALLPALAVDILPAPGDQGGPALRTAGELLDRVASTSGEVILLSDGVGDPADSLSAVHDLRKRGVATSVLGLGTLAGAPEPTVNGGFAATSQGSVRLTRLDEAGLVALANAGGGRYLRLDQTPVSELLRESIDRDPAHARAAERGSERWVEKGPWLLLPLILIAASGFRRGWLGVWLVVLIPPPQAFALSWQDLWLRPDQQAIRLLERGEASAAAERFEDPSWQALARYQAGDYPAAAAGFVGQDADSRYNRGNALARSGRLQEALAAYDQVLQQQPEHKDARFNRDLVERLLRQQQTSETNRDNDPSPEREPDPADQNEPAENAGRQPSSDAAAGQSETSDLAGQQDATRPQEELNNDSEAAATDEHATGAAADEQSARDDREDNAPPPRGDNLDRAGADLSPAPQTPSTDQGSTPAQSEQGANDNQPAVTQLAQQETVSEQELALEQWLRQVPDDPSGLLRRKFMLEHLFRQHRNDQR